MAQRHGAPGKSQLWGSGAHVAPSGVGDLIPVVHPCVSGLARQGGGCGPAGGAGGKRREPRWAARRSPPGTLSLEGR